MPEYYVSKRADGFILYEDEDGTVGGPVGYFSTEEDLEDWLDGAEYEALK